jgi:carbon catabolite-derepressing protein kinase
MLAPNVQQRGAAPSSADRTSAPLAPPQSAAARQRATSVSRRRASEEPPQPDIGEEARISHVRILPTSLPYVHEQLMEQREREQRARNEILEQRLQEAGHLNREGQAAAYRDMSPEEQAATARALKPHSRSVVDLDKLRFEPPIGQPIEKQPKRSRKWQFGIRSRNQPYEAMLYLYRAIAAQGGLWDIQPAESGKPFCLYLLNPQVHMLIFHRNQHRSRCDPLPRSAKAPTEQIPRPPIRLLHPQGPMVHPRPSLERRH